MTPPAKSRPGHSETAELVASVLNSLRRTVRAFRAAAMVAEDVLEISGAQHFVLQQLADAPAVSLNDLAARTMTHKSSVSVVVSRLVARGFVRRERSAADGRGVVVTLTPAGRRALRRAPDSAQTRLMAALQRLDRKELAGFARLFERFTDELGIRSLAPHMLFEEERRPRAAAPPSRPSRQRRDDR
ncbi:MAG: MarR family transcriptional regulator [Gemmatimonadales bacterium]